MHSARSLAHQGNSKLPGQVRHSEAGAVPLAGGAGFLRWQPHHVCVCPIRSENFHGLVQLL